MNIKIQSIMKQMYFMNSYSIHIRRIPFPRCFISARCSICHLSLEIKKIQNEQEYIKSSIKTKIKLFRTKQ